MNWPLGVTFFKMKLFDKGTLQVKHPTVLLTKVIWNNSAFNRVKF